MNANDAMLLAAENRQFAMAAVTVAATQLSPTRPPLTERRYLSMKGTRVSIMSRTHPNHRPEGRGLDQPAGIDIAGLTKRYLTPKGVTFTAIKDVTLAVEPGQFCSIVGPTGCGKSTTLAQVSGLERPSAGSVKVGGSLVDGITDGVSYMFQADALFPWKSVLRNVMMGPILLGTPKREAAELAMDWIRRVGLAGFEDRYPHQLSGGMRKRVAMATALINKPRILLMDEPFGALDAQTKVIMQNELLKLWEELRPSVLFITHDLDEAVALSDRVVIMTSSPGAVKDVYDVDLPRPRGNVQQIRHEPRFLELQERIWESLKDEVTRAYARSAGAAA
jgi:NitT/TauT family transport system ATP-binding protein